MRTTSHGSAYEEAFSEIKLPVVLSQAALNLASRDDFWPADVATVIRRADSWAISTLKSGLRVGRSAGAGASYPKAPKEKWKFAKAGEEWFCFAGLWRPPCEAGLRPSSFSPPALS